MCAEIEFSPQYKKNLGIYGDTYTFKDRNILITFTDGTILKLASWDGDSYSSGIAKQIININK
jgi:hypothetical protein